MSKQTAMLLAPIARTVGYLSNRPTPAYELRSRDSIRRERTAKD